MSITQKKLYSFLLPNWSKISKNMKLLQSKFYQEKHNFKALDCIFALRCQHLL